MTTITHAFGRSVRRPGRDLARLVLCLFLLSGMAGESAAESSLRVVQERGTLVMGADIPYGVMEFFDDAGNPTGIDIDIAQELAAALEVELSIKTFPFDELFDRLARDEIDVVISAVTITPERQEKMLFSIPYLDAGMSIAVAQDNQDIMSEADLAGKRVGVLKGTVGEGLMEKSAHVDSTLLQRYSSNDQRLKDLVDGKLDAIIVHFLTHHHPSIKIIQPPLTQSFYGVVTRLENDSLMAAINARLRTLKRQGRITEIKSKYTN